MSAFNVCFECDGICSRFPVMSDVSNGPFVCSFQILYWMRQYSLKTFCHEWRLQLAFWMGVSNQCFEWAFRMFVSNVASGVAYSLSLQVGSQLFFFNAATGVAYCLLPQVASQLFFWFMVFTINAMYNITFPLVICLVLSACFSFFFSTFICGISFHCKCCV